MLKKFKNETLFGRTKWLYFCFIFVYFYQFLSGFIKEKDFLVASFVHFYQPKKLQATDQTLRAACRQRHTNEHFSRLRAGIPSAGNFFSFYSFTRHHTSRRQPANTTTPATSFLTEQISAFRFLFLFSFYFLFFIFFAFSFPFSTYPFFIQYTEFLFFPYFFADFCTKKQHPLLDAVSFLFLRFLYKRFYAY